MDKNHHLGARALLKHAVALLVPLLVLAAAGAECETAEADTPKWANQLQEALAGVDAAHSGELGVYVKDLASGVAVSLRAEESWYLASGVKVPVAIAILRDVEAGKLSLDTRVRLVESDYVDGAGQTNSHQPGSALSIRYLLEEMLTVSDNTASDVLIRVTGLEHVNEIIQELVPSGFGAVTSLADVRRHAYSGFHPNAFNLKGKDFFAIKKERSERRRIEALAELLGVSPSDFELKDIDSVFAAYYATNLNGGQLNAYGQLLEAIVAGKALKPDTTNYLLAVLLRTQTGARRIKAGLPASVAFAHKTGTQHRRICDLGVAMHKAEAALRQKKSKLFEELPKNGAIADSPRLVITACSRDFKTRANAEAALRAVGEAVNASGILHTGTARAL